MEWWRIAIALFDLYLLITVGPWVALQIIQSVLFGSGETPYREVDHGARLQRTCDQHGDLWPTRPRVGPYEPLDMAAHDEITALQAMIASVAPQLDAVRHYVIRILTLDRVLTLGAWPPLLDAVTAWRDLRTVRRGYASADEIARRLRDLQVQMEAIPEGSRSALTAHRAEIRRLQAHVEVQQDSGTEGLDDLLIRLREAESAIESALDNLATTEDAQIPPLIESIERRCDDLNTLVDEADRTVSEVEEAHRRSREARKRVREGIADLDLRWQGLLMRGARSDKLSQQLAALHDDTEHLTVVAKRLNLQTFTETLTRAPELENQIKACAEEMELLDSLLTQSGEAIAGDVKTLGQAQQACETLVQQIPQLQLDVSLPLIEAASERFVVAEKDRARGDRNHLESALSHSRHARSSLDQARDALEPVAGQVTRLHALLDRLDPSQYEALYERLSPAAEALRPFGAYWDNRAEVIHDQAIELMERSWKEMAQTPPEVLQRKTYRQSTLADMVALLGGAETLLSEAEVRVNEIVDQQRSVASSAQELEAQLRDLLNRAIPALDEYREEMLPELAERLDVVERTAHQHLNAIKSPAHLDLEKAIQITMPELFGEVDDVEQSHLRDLDRYEKQLQDALTTLSKSLDRFMRVEPHAKPGPDEDVGQLENEVKQWISKATDEDSDLATVDTLIHQAGHLEERIRQAHEQTVSGRREIESLTHQYHRVASNVRSLKGAVETLQNTGRWGHLIWPVDEPDSAWEEALAQERDSQAAQTLVSATEKLQRAIAAAQLAEQAYIGIEKSMSSAIQRLNNELRSVEASLTKGQQLAQELGRHNQVEEQQEVQTLCTRVAHLVRIATSSPSAEDALRHLQDAKAMCRRL